LAIAIDGVAAWLLLGYGIAAGVPADFFAWPDSAIAAGLDFGSGIFV
jgi:hypothetical protein